MHDTKQNQRYEIKFVTLNTNYALIKNWLKLNNYNFKKQYNDRIINNIYFDTYDLDTFKENIFGNSSRIKTRFRWYGPFEKKNSGNLELKYKRNVYGWKERFTISNLHLENKIDWKFVINKIYEKLPLNIKFFFNNNNIPQIINQYEREYFISENKKFRITIDKNKKVFDQRKMQKVNLEKKTTIQNYIVIEIKFEKSCYNQAGDLLQNIPMRVSKKSKYINSIRAVTGI